jgi:hypothetical protein
MAPPACYENRAHIWLALRPKLRELLTNLPPNFEKDTEHYTIRSSAPVDSTDTLAERLEALFVTYRREMELSDGQIRIHHGPRRSIGARNATSIWIQTPRIHTIGRFTKRPTR